LPDHIHNYSKNYPTTEPAIMDYTTPQEGRPLGPQRPDGNGKPLSQFFPDSATRSEDHFVDGEDIESVENPHGFFREAYLYSNPNIHLSESESPALDGESLYLVDHHQIELPMLANSTDAPHISLLSGGPLRSPALDNPRELQSEINTKWPDIARELLNLPDLPESIHPNLNETRRYGVHGEASVVVQTGLHLSPGISSSRPTHLATQQHIFFPVTSMIRQERLSASAALTSEATVAAKSPTPIVREMQALNAHGNGLEPFPQIPRALASPSPVALAVSPGVWAGAAVSGTGACLPPQPGSVGHPTVLPNSQVGAKRPPNLELQMVETRKSWFPMYEPDGSVDLFNGRKRRPKLTEERRRERCKVRDSRACFRCRKLKIKVCLTTNLDSGGIGGLI
jgi:hypothetical protein